MSPSPLRLLVINWQDIENPQAGGAEIHLHEIFERLVQRGHLVTLLCSGWPAAEPRARINGIEIHRVGGRHSFALRAAPFYASRLRRSAFDLVIEDINKIPLFSPLWAGKPVLALIPHLFGETAFQTASFGFAATAWLAERPLPLVYRAVPFQAISESTAADLEDRGIPPENIRVIHPGIDHSRFNPGGDMPRFPDPTFVYIGRLRRYKGLERVIDALAALAREGLPVRLLVAGKGDHEEALRRRAAERAPHQVTFLGYIAEEEKVDLLRRAWATVYPSPKEGWGITNVEAAACGTPALASDSPGLRESVRHGVSGLLVRHDDRAAWTRALRRIVEDRDLHARLSRGATDFARAFSWDRTAAETESHLLQVAASGPISGRDHFNTQVWEGK